MSDDYVRQTLDEIKLYLGNILSALDTVKVMLNNIEVYLGDKRQPMTVDHETVKTMGFEKVEEPEYKSKGLGKYVSKATEGQKDYIRKLYKMLGEKPGVDLDTISFETASALIDTLKKEVTRKGLWPKRKR